MSRGRGHHLCVRSEKEPGEISARALPADASPVTVSNFVADAPPTPRNASGSHAPAPSTAGRSHIISSNTVRSTGNVGSADHGALPMHNCSSSDVEANTSKPAPEKDKDQSKDCNAPALSAREVIYPARRRASHRASNPEIESVLTAIKRGDWFAEARAGGKGGTSASFGSKSPQRKFASAMIDKIPLPLSRHIAFTFKPRPDALSEAA